MTDPLPHADPSFDVHAAVEEAHRNEWGAVLGAVAAFTRDLDVAEECVQEAYVRALTAWSDGVPDRPGAWLTRVARNLAVDRARHERTAREKLPLLLVDEAVDQEQGTVTADDDLLRLVLLCCHPAIGEGAQVAMCLRLLWGLSTGDVARVLLLSESTAAARITRAKRKVATARIPLRLDPEDVEERIGGAVRVLYLVFTAGHVLPSGEALLGRTVCGTAIRLARLLHRRHPEVEDTRGLLALLLLTDAHRDARLDEGRLVLLADQDRTRWDPREIAEGTALVRASLQQPRLSPLAVQAAIAAVHAEAVRWEDTDWDEIVGLYDVLVRIAPSPVVDLNRAVALAQRDGPQVGLDIIDAIGGDPSIAVYRYVSAARADLLRRLQRWNDAAGAYEEALLMADNRVEQQYLAGRLAEVRSHLE